MGRLIDTDVLIKEIRSFREDGLFKEEIVEVIDTIPTAEQVEKGKWIKGETKWNCESEWNCSGCGDIVSLLEGNTPLKAELYFCPYCGTDMREDEDDTGV